MAGFHWLMFYLRLLSPRWLVRLAYGFLVLCLFPEKAAVGVTFCLIPFFGTEHDNDLNALRPKPFPPGSTRLPPAFPLLPSLSFAVSSRILVFFQAFASFCHRAFAHASCSLWEMFFSPLQAYLAFQGPSGCSLIVATSLDFPVWAKCLQATLLLHHMAFFLHPLHLHLYL